jgi:hypothetical protein
VIFHYSKFAVPAGGSIATSALPAGEAQRTDVTLNGTLNLDDILRMIFVYNAEVTGSTNVPNTPPVDKNPGSGESAAVGETSAPATPPASSPISSSQPVMETPPRAVEWDAAFLLAVKSLWDDADSD